MQEITLSGLPHSDAFNPALIHWRGRILIMYRVGGRGDAELYMGELDGDFKPAGEFQKITVPGTDGCEDPRFFIHRDQLFFSFGAYYLNRGRFRMGFGIVNDDLTTRDCCVLEGANPLMDEKNWIFFSHSRQLYFTYAMADGVHDVHRLKDDRSESTFRTYYNDPWKWGLARGGTQLILHEGLWYGFFHGTNYYIEGLDRRYFMGAYAVSPEPPFPIVRMSATPLYTPPEARFHPATRNSSSRMVANVFPTGLMLERNTWHVCSGYNNHRIKVFTISHRELESNLISTVPGEPSGGEGILNPAISRRRPGARVHWFPIPADAFWSQPFEFVEKYKGRGETVFADVGFNGHWDEFQSYDKITPDRLQEGINWVVLHKDYADHLDLAALDELQLNYMAVFANEVFVTFTNKVLPVMEPRFDPVHVEALWVKVANRKSNPLSQRQQPSAT